MKVIKLTATARANIESLRNLVMKKKANMLVSSPSDVHPVDEFLADTELWAKSSTEPTVIQPLNEYRVLLDINPEGTLFLYQDSLYDVRGKFTSAQQRLLVLEAADKERRLFERLKVKFDLPGGKPGTRTRHRIPEAVRIEVWRRDQGRCSTPGCGSRENLEYDHIIPLDAGGSNTSRNVELLCEACNRRKSNKIQ